MNTITHVPVGRFAPSPTGRMHLGNLLTALVSWLSVRSRGGNWILRIEDLDPQRSKADYARQIEEDLLWLGLDWDEGGLADRGEAGPYSQSRRGELYEAALGRLRDAGLVYPCRCTRADLNATQAPHASDGRTLYTGRCRPEGLPRQVDWGDGRSSVRLYVGDEPEVEFTDGVFGRQRVSLQCECGDYVVRRADGAWAYQLAVVVDDALMGVTEVVRGSDLLGSAAQQIALHRVLGYEPPEYVHLPLVCNAAGQRLSKRDPQMALDALRSRYTAREIIGMLGRLAGINPTGEPCTPEDLLQRFTLSAIPRVESVTCG